MDTTTHVSMGIALGAVATLDPAIAENAELFKAVMIGTVVGSIAPDFDTILKLKNNAVYIRHHRGITHSTPAIFFCGITIAFILHQWIAIDSEYFLRLFLWTLFALFLHVCFDLLNAYGTQVLLPFSKKWIAFSMIHTFDWVIFSLHILGFIVWVTGLSIGYLWLFIYVIIVLYLINRYYVKRMIMKRMHEQIPNVEKIILSPTFYLRKWRMVISTKDDYFVGQVQKGMIHIIDRFPRKEEPDFIYFTMAKKDRNVMAFLSFSPIYSWNIRENKERIEIRFFDLRYRSKDHYPFVAIVKINKMEKQKICSYTGWIYSEEKLQKKLQTKKIMI